MVDFLKGSGFHLALSVVRKMHAEMLRNNQN